MKKNDFWKIILILVLVLPFNLAVFLATCKADRTATFWVSYGFVMFSNILLGVALFSAGKRTKVFSGLSFLALTLIYNVLALLLGIIFIIAHDIIVVFPFIAQSFLVIFYIGLSIIGLMGTNLTAEKLARDDEHLRFLNTLAYQVSILEQRATDEPVKKHLNELFEALKSSPYNSNPGAREIEQRLEAKVEELKKAMAALDYALTDRLAGEALTILAERNNYLKINR
jgi:hypothetical protein